MQNNISIIIERICGAVPEDRVLRDEPMSRHTSFRIGGPAAAFVIVNNEEELAGVLSAVTAAGAEHMIIGNGSNLLVLHKAVHLFRSYQTIFLNKIQELVFPEILYEYV